MRRHSTAHPAWGRALVKAMDGNQHLKTQTALARKSGVAQSTIGRILRGEVNPQSGNLHRLARALGLPLTTLTRMAEDSQLEVGPATVQGTDAVSTSEEIDRALRQALASREDRKRSEQALETLRRKENDAIDRLQGLMRARRPPAEPESSNGDSATC